MMWSVESEHCTACQVLATLVARAIRASCSLAYPLQVLGAELLSFQQWAPVLESMKPQMATQQLELSSMTPLQSSSDPSQASLAPG